MIWVAIGYLAVFVVGIVAIFARTHGETAATAEYLAARTLVRNHRVSLADLERNPLFPPQPLAPKSDTPRVLGMYAAADIPYKTPLSADRLRAAPAVTVAPDHVALLVSLKEQEALADVADVGWTVDLCRAATCTVQDAPILAVLCPAASPAACFALVEIPRSRLEFALKDDDKQPKIRLLPRRMTP